MTMSTTLTLSNGTQQASSSSHDSNIGGIYWLFLNLGASEANMIVI